MALASESSDRFTAANFIRADENKARPLGFDSLGTAKRRRKFMGDRLKPWMKTSRGHRLCKMRRENSGLLSPSNGSHPAQLLDRQYEISETAASWMDEGTR